MPEPTIHVPVMMAEVLESLAARPGQIIVDGTLGGAGHARRLAELVRPGGRVVALDRDPAALERARTVLGDLPVELCHSNFADLPDVLRQLQLPPVDGILLDLGLSSDQLADSSRGFSFSADGPLDLRFNPEVGPTAARYVAELNAEDLANLIYEYGEERFSRRIARAIVERRRTDPIRTAGQLAELVRRVVPRGRDRIDPATRTFQALRIAVNRELDSLEQALQQLPDCLAPGGRIVIISFHSLEDRMVKQAFRGDARLEPLTKKPLTATDAEVAANPRSRSAKLRAAQRVG